MPAWQACELRRGLPGYMRVCGDISVETVRQQRQARRKVGIACSASLFGWFDEIGTWFCTVPNANRLPYDYVETRWRRG